MMQHALKNGEKYQNNVKRQTILRYQNRYYV